MTEMMTETPPAAEMSAEERINQLRELFADTPEVGKKALETVLSRLASDASTAPPPVQSAGRAGSRLGKVSELTIIVPFAPAGAQRLRTFLQLFGGNLAGADDVGIDSAWAGWPGIRSPQAKDYLAKYQVTAEGWYVANDLTVAETRRLRKIGQATEQFLDAIGD